MSKLLTIEQAAERMDCSVPTVYVRLNNKKLSAIKKGYRTFIAESEIERYNAENTTEYKPSKAAN